MRYFIFVIFLAFAIPASANELVKQYLNKKEDVYLESAYAWCASAGALESKRRILSFIYGERSQDRSVTVLSVQQSFFDYAVEKGWKKKVKWYQEYRPMLDEAKTCYDLAKYQEKVYRNVGKLRKPEAIKNVTLGDENEKTILIKYAYSYCSDNHLNDIKARLAAFWYEGVSKYAKRSQSKNQSWLKYLKKKAAKGDSNASQMAAILESKKDGLFSQTTCKGLQDFINAEFQPFTEVENFWS